MSRPARHAAGRAARHTGARRTTGRATCRPTGGNAAQGTSGTSGGAQRTGRATCRPTGGKPTDSKGGTSGEIGSGTGRTAANGCRSGHRPNGCAPSRAGGTFAVSGHAAHLGRVAQGETLPALRGCRKPDGRTGRAHHGRHVWPESDTRRTWGELPRARRCRPSEVTDGGTRRRANDRPHRSAAHHGTGDVPTDGRERATGQGRRVWYNSIITRKALK